MAVIVTRYKDVEITVDAGGKFKGEKDDVRFEAETMAEIRDKIDKELVAANKRQALALPVVGILAAKSDSYHANAKKLPRAEEIARAKIIGINRTTGQLQLAGLPEGYEMASLLPDTADAAELLALYQKAKATVELVDGYKLDSRNGYGRIGAEEYASVLAKIEARYKAFSEAPAKS